MHYELCIKKKVFLMTKAQRIDNFRKLERGMFVHYGLFSVLGRGECIRDGDGIPTGEYEKLTERFNPAPDFAERLVWAAKSAGMNYITFTTRHQEGFSLFDTKGLDGFDAPHGACRRDLVAEFVEACRRHGIVPFLYCTTKDWHRAEFETDFPAYQRYLRASVELLCRNYGEIGGFWFDGNWSKPNADWEETALYAVIRKYLPNAIIINNTGLSAAGQTGHEELDAVTFERRRPTGVVTSPTGVPVAMEMCEVLASHWGFCGRDLNYKSMRDILGSYMTCKKYGANFLLNVGPQADGSLRGADAAFLELFGAWTGIHREALDGTRPTGIACGGDDFVTRNGAGDYYLFVDGLPMVFDANVALSAVGEKNVALRGFPAKAKRIVWLDNGAPLAFEQDADVLKIRCHAFPYGTDLIWRVARITV
jgi:alpha-L-fucosidase